MNDYFEKMREDLDRHAQSQVRGLSTRDVVSREYSENDLLKLLEELKAETSFGVATFHFCSFIHERQEKRIPDSIRSRAADNVVDHVRALETNVDQGAVEMFVAWGSHRADHKNICVQILDHPETWIRKIALIYSGSFLLPCDYPKLLKFKQDRDVSEIAMGGPLRFILRDHALEVLKRLTRCSITEADCFEDTSEGRVFYRSWTPFLNWFEKQGT